MRVNRRTGALQLSGGNAQLAPVKQEKKNIIKGALRGLAALGVGLALFAGAVSPQTAWAEGSEANAWQIVSGSYEDHNTEDCTTTSKDGNVRVHKSVEATDKENEFIVHLSIDKRPDAVDDFFNGVLHPINSDQGKPKVGDAVKINGTVQSSGTSYYQLELYAKEADFDSGNPIRTGEMSCPKLSGEIKHLLIKANDTAEQGLVIWSGGNVTPSYGGDGTEEKPWIVKVAMEWPGFGEIFGTSATSVSLDSVSDPMGDYITYVDSSATTKNGTANFNKDTKTLTWTISSENTDAAEDSDGWLVNVASLDYRITLNVKQEGFNSCGLDYAEEDPKDPENVPGNCVYQTNGYKRESDIGETETVNAKLEYTVKNLTSDSSGDSTGQDASGSCEFTIPKVCGLLYDLKFKKVDQNGNALTGAKFELQDAEGNKVCDEQEVGEDGTLEFSGLAHGDYVLVETKTPDGFEKPKDNPEGKTPVTLCYTTKVKGGKCCSVENAVDLKACDTHPNNAVNERDVEIVNVRSTVDYVLPVYKAIDGRPWNENDSFTFRIEGVGRAEKPDEELDRDYNMPLPQCPAGDNQTQITIDYQSNDYYGMKTESFCPITFSEPGYYIYKVTELPSDGKSDLVYDDPWYVKINISDTDAGGGLGEMGMWVTQDLNEWAPSTRAAVAFLLFTNRYISFELPSALKETKQVKGHDANAGDFKFSVQATGDTAGDAAELAALEGLASSLRDGKYDKGSHTLTFSNEDEIAVNDNAKEVRTANQLKLTAANIGHTYVYEYRELPSEEDPAWHQQQETVWRVSVAVDWATDHEQSKDAIQATLTLEKSTDGGTSWKPEGVPKVYASNSTQRPDPFTVSFVNEYGSTLQIKKEDQNGNPLVGAEFKISNSQYDATATTKLSEDKKDALATFENIPDGSFTVSETAVPGGYQRIIDMTLTIEGNEATLKWKDTGQLVGEGTVTKENGVFTITITNYANPNLPSSGSSGAVVLGGVGITAILTAGAWLARRKGIA